MDHDIMPLEHITGQKPNLTHIRIFGCPVGVAVPMEKQKKWEECSCMGYMVGYEPYSSGYTKTQVQFLGTQLKGNASEWFTRNIEHPDWPIRDWSLESVIEGLQK